MEQINLKSSAIDKYSYLSNLRNTNAGLFYRLLIDHMKVRALWRATARYSWPAEPKRC